MKKIIFFLVYITVNLYSECCTQYGLVDENQLLSSELVDGGRLYGRHNCSGWTPPESATIASVCIGVGIHKVTRPTNETHFTPAGGSFHGYYSDGDDHYCTAWFHNVVVETSTYKCACNEEDDIPEASSGWNYIEKRIVGQGVPQNWEDLEDNCKNIKVGKEQCVEYNYFYVKEECDCKKGYAPTYLIQTDLSNIETCSAFCADASDYCVDAYLFAEGAGLDRVDTCCEKSKDVTYDDNNDPIVTTTETTTNPNGSKTTTTTATNQNTGATTTSSTTTNMNGTQTTTSTTTNPNGSSTSTTNSTNANGSSTTTTTVTNEDGSTTSTSTTTNADGSTTTTTTSIDGSTTTTTTPPNDAKGDTNTTNNILSSILGNEKSTGLKLDGIREEIARNGQRETAIKNSITENGGKLDSINSNLESILNELKNNNDSNSSGGTVNPGGTGDSNSSGTGDDDDEFEVESSVLNDLFVSTGEYINSIDAVYNDVKSTIDGSAYDTVFTHANSCTYVYTLRNSTFNINICKYAYMFRPYVIIILSFLLLYNLIRMNIYFYFKVFVD